MHNGSPRASIKSRHDGFQESWEGKLGEGAGLERGEITAGRGHLPSQPLGEYSGDSSGEGPRDSGATQDRAGASSPLWAELPTSLTAGFSSVKLGKL